jgi:hypothetical protein
LVTQESPSGVGWRATAGCFDEKSLLSDFQTSLPRRIKILKDQNYRRKTELYDGRRVFNSKTLNVYRFLSDDAGEWQGSRCLFQTSPRGAIRLGGNSTS